MMGSRFKFLIASIVILLILFFIANDKSPIQKMDIDPSVFQNGDVILTNGKSFKSRIVRLFDLSSNSFTHAGIVKVEEGLIFVIHSTPDGESRVVCEPLEHVIFKEDLDNWAILRMRNLTVEMSNDIVMSAEVFLKAKTPFDMDFDLSTKGKLYCTELIVECYRSTGKELFPDKKGEDHIYPSMFCSDQNFVEVFNANSSK